MSRRTGIVLLVVIAALGGIIYYLNLNPSVAKGDATPTSTPPSQPTALWTVDPSQIASLTIVDVKKNVTFTAGVDATGAWTITSPSTGPADATTMATYINSAATLSVTRSLDNISSLADFGLAAPSFSLTIKTKDNKQFSASIGNKDVTGAGYYVLANGSKIPVLVSSGSLDALLGLPAAPPIATATPAFTSGPLPTLPVSGTATP